MRPEEEQGGLACAGWLPGYVVQGLAERFQLCRSFLEVQQAHPPHPPHPPNPPHPHIDMIVLLLIIHSHHNCCCHMCHKILVMFCSKS